MRIFVFSIFFAIFLFSCAKTQSITQQDIPREEPPGCRLSVVLDAQDICLDGVWILSSGVLGEDAEYVFKRERNYLFLVPVLHESRKKELRGRLDPHALDMFTLEQALSIQGTPYQNMLFFEQQNALVAWQETSRMRLYWRETHFEGADEITSARETTVQKIKISLKPVKPRS
ncbi:MAG: hypothetical protein LBC99_01475 [Spirochaetota bacterium]|nr:hypothetical protein [Spirochaetota bacterium]